MKRIISTLLAVMLLLSSFVTANAETPPYSKEFDSKDSMLSELAKYCESFPDVEDYFMSDLSEERPNMHLERKKVIIPNITADGYIPTSYSYGEVIWGYGVSSVNSVYESADDRVTVLTYLHNNPDQIDETLESMSKDTTENIYSGTVNSYDFVAKEKIGELTSMCTYYIDLDDKLVIIYTYQPYNRTFLESIEFETTDIMLPVYVDNGYYAQQFEEYLLYLGIDPALEGSEDWYTYSEHYDYYSQNNTSQTPDWVLVSGYAGETSPVESNSIFGEYSLILSNLYFPRDFYYIYFPSTNKFITLGAAWTQKVEDIEKAFTEYFIPNGYVEYIEDTDGDGVITIVDAKKYDNDFTVYNSFEEESQPIYFDANTTDWENYNQVYCHITEDGTPKFAWQSKNELCTDTNNDGVWEYYVAPFHSSRKYEVVFSNNRGEKTPGLTMTNDNIMDTVYQSEGYTLDENGNKVFMPAWRNHPREIYFDANTTDWKDYSKIFCHIWEAGGDIFHEWQSRKERCTDENGDGIWEYNLDSAGIYLDESKEYGVIFSDEKGDQIYHLLLNSDNIGGTVELSGKFAYTEHGTQYNIPVWKSSILNFDTNTTDWENYSKVYCHIWEYGGDGFFNWQSKKERCIDSDNDGIWTYDLESKGIELEEGKQYVVIFSNENGHQTYNLIFDETVLGDTAYVDGVKFDPNEDGVKIYPAFWRNQDKTKFGPQMVINSIGEIQGTCVPKDVTKYDLFKDFLERNLDNAQKYSGKTDQQLIDDLAKGLDFTANEVEFIFKELEIYYMDCAWKKSKSTLEKSNITSPEQKDVHQVVRDYKDESGDKFNTKRYYFMMPNVVYAYPPEEPVENRPQDWTWYNKYAQSAYIYWSGTGRLNLEGVGNMAMIADDHDNDIADELNIYYADVPDFVTSIEWNNGVELSGDENDPMLPYAHKTVHIPCEYYDEGENELYPDGVDSFENMIYVLDPDAENLESSEQGEWYYYYGKSCYGTKKNGDKLDCKNPHHSHTKKQSVKEVLDKYEKQTGEKVNTNRYYFLMPNGSNGQKGDDPGYNYYDKFTPTWYNKYTDTAGVYWWDVNSSYDPTAIQGYSIEKSNSSDVYYVDLPKDVNQIVWTNFAFATMGIVEDKGKHRYLRHSTDCYLPHYTFGELDGETESGDWIYVIDPDLVTTNEDTLLQVCGGEWYRYYGNGCYGTEIDGECIRDDHDHRVYDTYIVAGVEALCGSSWDLYDMNNKMTFNEKSGAYEITYTDVPVGNHEFMVTKNFEFGPITPGNPDYNEANVTVEGSKVTITYTEGVGVDVIVTAPLLGDVDLDGVVSIMDATEIQLAISKKITLSEKQEKLADTDCDGEVSVLDATEIQLFVAKKITEFK